MWDELQHQDVYNNEGCVNPETPKDVPLDPELAGDIWYEIDQKNKRLYTHAHRDFVDRLTETLWIRDRLRLMARAIEKAETARQDCSDALVAFVETCYQFMKEEAEELRKVEDL